VWFNSESALKKQGFEGFRDVDSLTNDMNSHSLRIEGRKGIYIMLYNGRDRPTFVEEGSGGWFKGKNPNYCLKTVEGRWIEGAMVLYIGKTDRPLRTRISEFLKFGQGHNIGHRGGRLVWQIQNRENLELCWMNTESDSESLGEIERRMIAEFKDAFGRRPYANISA